MTEPVPEDAGVADDRRAERARFRRVLVKVMVVQVITLLLLWLLQLRFHSA